MKNEAKTTSGPSGASPSGSRERKPMAINPELYALAMEFIRLARACKRAIRTHDIGNEYIGLVDAKRKVLEQIEEFDIEPDAPALAQPDGYGNLTDIMGEKVEHA